MAKTRRPRHNRLIAELRAHKFYPTLDACNLWFSITNDEVFSNKLVPITFSIKRLRGSWGYYDADKGENGTLILTTWFSSKELFLNVLAHEMVHVYQHQFNQPIGHGKSFWEWRKRFKRNGLTLASVYHGHSIKSK